MKAILVVWNKAGKGKTESIREFVKLLLNTYPGFTAIYPTLIKIDPKGDFLIVVKVNGKVIGIVSQGDPGTGLGDKLLKLVKVNNCDIIICSTRTSGETVNSVLDVARKNKYEVIWTSTYEIEGQIQQTFVNNLKGKHMLDLLQSLGII
jgi:hypothetical protein